VPPKLDRPPYGPCHACLVAERVEPCVREVRQGSRSTRGRPPRSLAPGPSASPVPSDMSLLSIPPTPDGQLVHDLPPEVDTDGVFVRDALFWRQEVISAQREVTMSRLANSSSDAQYGVAKSAVAHAEAALFATQIALQNAAGERLYARHRIAVANERLASGWRNFELFVSSSCSFPFCASLSDFFLLFVDRGRC
jgi:hypothetical protein